ncbi:MAG: Ig-like domain repeat protein [Eubacteriaceae bacterium]|nr:Ig-like domain repeat protein [Eubacteriaceae bacterium]
MKNNVALVLAAMIILAASGSAYAADPIYISSTGSSRISAGSFSSSSEDIKKFAGKNIGQTSMGSWFEYSLRVSKTGIYRFSIISKSSQAIVGAFVTALNGYADPTHTLSLEESPNAFSASNAVEITLFEGLNSLRFQSSAVASAEIEAVIAEAVLGSGETVVELVSETPERIAYGEKAKFTCTVSVSGQPASGSIAFMLDGQRTSSIELDGQGRASHTYSALNAGQHIVAAIYDANGTNQYTQSNALTLIVNKITAVPTDSYPELSAIYGQKLSDIKLKDGYRWENPNQTVGNASESPNSFICLFSPDEQNYSDYVFEASVRVSKREITIKAVDKEKVVGTEDPKLDLDVTEGIILPGDYIAGTLKHNGSKVGVYEIIEGEKLYNSNYEIEFVPGKIEIKPTESMKAVLDGISATKPIAGSEDADSFGTVYTKYLSLTDNETACLPDETQRQLDTRISEAKRANHDNSSAAVDSSSLPWYVRITATDAKDRIKEKFQSQSGSLLGLLNIELTNTLDLKPYSLDGEKIAVTLKNLDKSIDGDIVLAHEALNGTLEYIKAKAENGQVQFETASFSLYALARREEDFHEINMQAMMNTTRARLRWLPFFCLFMVIGLPLALRKQEKPSQEKRPKAQKSMPAASKAAPDKARAQSPNAAAKLIRTFKMMPKQHQAAQNSKSQVPKA